MGKMQPIGAWLKDGFGYMFENWLMLLKAYGWGMVIYFGSSVLAMLSIAAIAAVMTMLGFGWNFLTTILGVVLGLFYVIFLFSMAGRMFYLQISAIKSPITDIRASWSKISWKDGLALYLVLLLAVFAGYGGMILLIIPGIVVFTWVSMAVFVKAEQGIGGIQALMLSRDYVRGYFWPIQARFLTMMLVFGLVGFADAYLILIFSEAKGLLGMIGWVLYMASVLGIMAVMSRLGYTLYLDMVRLKGKLELVTTPWRTFRWSLLAYSPLVLMVVSMFIFMVINPAEQIQKAKDAQVQQQQIMFDRQNDLK